MKRSYGTIKAFMILLLVVCSVKGQGQCGNNASKGTTDCSCKNCPGDPFDPYTGNEYRKIKDLEVWGSVGEIPLVWTRYAYSRFGGFLYNFGHSHNWNNSFNYNMTDAGLNEEGRAMIYIHYAEGGSGYFTQQPNNPGLWLPLHEVDKRLFQEGNNFYLQMANGHRYRFEKLSDPSGFFYQLQDIRDSKQNLYKLTYNSKHLLTRVTEPAGRYLQITHDTVFGVWRVITKVTTSDGRSVHYRYDLLNDGLISSLSLVSADYGDGTKAEYSYSQSEPGSRPNLEHAVDPRYEGMDVNMAFTYDNDNVWGFIKEEKNGITGKVMTTLNAEAGKSTVCYANGRVQVYTLPADMLGKIKEYMDGLGRIIKYSYQNGVGFLQSEKDALGRVTFYDSLTIYGNPIELTHPDGSKERWTRDDLDLVLTYTDALNRTTTYKRDSKHRVTRINYADGSNESFTYNNLGQVLTHTRKNKGIESSVYNSRGLKTHSIDAEQNLAIFTYDQADRLASLMDARNNVTRYRYNERGLVDTVVNADKSFQTYNYDTFGNRTKTTNETGNSWTTLYDEFKRPDRLTDPLGRLIIYQYSLPGGICGCSHDNSSPTSIIYPDGKVTTMEYDVEWQKTSETVAAGTPDAATTFYEYDAAGNLVMMINPLGKSTASEFDQMNRRKGFTDPLGNKTQWIYDEVGNIKSIIRPDKKTVNFQYDKMNRVIQTTDPGGQETNIRLDEEGNVTRLTDPGGHHSYFTYDLLNRQTRITYPGGSSESFTYDPLGNVKTHTNRAGNIQLYTYDERNREVKFSWSDNTPAVTRVYDAAGRIQSLSSSVSLLTYTYSDAGELTSETQHITGSKEAKKVSYSFDLSGLQSDMTYPDGSVVQYNYTSRNQLKNISLQGAPLVAYSYDLNGNRSTKTLGNGISTSYTYDDANRIVNIDSRQANVSLASLHYGYDHLNRRTFVKRDGSKGDTYAYDLNDQVSRVQYESDNPETLPVNPLRDVKYKWDAAGNRSAVTDNDTATNYSVNNRNQYTRIGGSPLTYGADENLKTYEGWRYTYDAQGRLITASKGSSMARFKYDARNRCVSREINNKQTFLYYDNWNLIEETNSQGAEVTQYIYGALIDEVLRKSSSAGILYYQQDAIGSVTQLTNSLGNIVEQYSYDVFGSVTIKDKIGKVINQTAFGNRFLFCGREFIQEINLIDYRHRMYSSGLGRFLQTDPMLYSAGDYNLYRYVFNNSVNNIDPWGLGDTSAWGLGWEWLTGTGPRDRDFTDGDPFTEQLREHSNIREAIEKAKTMAAQNCTTCNSADFDFDASYNLGGLAGVPKYIGDYSTLLTGGLTGNIAVTYLGSYSGRAYVSSISCCNGTAKVKIVVKNSSTAASASRPPVLGYTNWWQTNIAPGVNNFFSSGMMSKTTQTITLNESITFTANKNCKN